MKVTFRYFLLFLLLLTALTSSSQGITFNRIIPPVGKTFEHVTGMAQDQQGYMWLATKRGLFRYDGYQMISYKHSPMDLNSLVTDALETVAVDPKGMIWVGTGGSGLDRFDPSTGTFTHFRHQRNDPASLGNDFVFALFADRDGVLWIGTAEGLDRYDPSTGKFKHYRHLQNDSTSISCNEVVSIYEDRKGTLWIGTGSVYGKDGDKMEVGGLNRFNKKTETFTRYMHNSKDQRTLINNKVKAIFEDSKGNFWVGTAGDGLHKMDRATGTFQRLRYDPAFPEKLSRPPLDKLFGRFDHIRFIREDVSGAIWIGTTEAGLNHYNPVTRKVTHYRWQKDTTGAFTNRTTWAACTSSDGIFWVSTLEGTLYTVNPVKWNIPFYKSTNGSINAFFEEADGSFWIGTDYGLIQNNTQKKTSKKFLHDPANPASSSSNRIQAINKDHRGNIWVGTREGLQMYNRKTESFTHYRYNAKNTNTLSSDDISAIYEDRNANLWVGTFRGLNRLSLPTGVITRYIFYPGDTSYFSSNTISSVLQDRQGRFWSSSALAGGVQRFNPENGKFRDYLKGNGIVNIIEDSKGIIWAAGNNLYQFDPKADTFSHFVDPVSAIEINNIRSFMQDEKGTFWIAKSDGILKIDRQRNESIFYNEDYGVNGNGLAFGACYRGLDGKLYFGHDDGFYAFLPSDLTKSMRPPQIVLSDFRLANQLVKPGENSALPRPLAELKTIQLRYNQNVFSFDFAAIDYANPGNNRHLFMLKNYDNEWRQSGAEHRAYYFNVPPGHYTFIMKGANSYGIWAQKSIDIIISRPWWETWWFRVMSVIALVIIVYAIIIERSRKLRAENVQLEQKVADRTAQLKKSLEELKATQSQLIQQEKMASLGELTAGIAHEIQNPLNFVNNFSEVNKELVDELQSELKAGNLKEVVAISNDIKSNEEKISYHGKRADTIVKGMLQHSRSTSSQKEPTNINALADEYLRLSYHGLRAKDKSFNATMQTAFDKSIGDINIVRQDIGRVLLNLYNNAFYALNEKKKQEGESYQPTVNVSTKTVKPPSGGLGILISVKDNGNGIPQKVIDKIFQPFFTTKPTGQGTGLGLSLAYDIVKAHGGDIKVETKEGEGSEFIIQLPIT